MNQSFIIVSTEPRFRGGEFQLLLLANELAKREYPITIACNAVSPMGKADCPSAKWVRFRHRHGMDLNGCFALIREIAASDHPVLLCNDSKALTLGFLVSLLRRVKLVAVRRVCFAFAKNWISRVKYRSCSRIVAISTAVAERCRLTLPGSSVTIIPSATVPPPSIDNGKTIRDRLGLNAGHFVCLSVADFTNPGKRFSLLMTTATELCKRYPGFHLVLVGHLPETPDPLPSWCVATGFSKNPRDYYAAAQMYLCTSLHEGLGTAILDAVVRDIPAVAPLRGGAPDLFPDEAWLADEENGISFLQRSCEILDDSRKAHARAVGYGRYARQRFSLSTVVDKYAALIDELTGTPSVPAYTCGISRAMEG